MFVRFAVPVFVLALLAAPAAAQDVAPIELTGLETAAIQLPPPPAPALPAPLPARDLDADRRPAALMPLYASFIALQGLDVHSTTRGLSRGAVEANPLMKDVAGNPGALFAVKAASTAGIVYGVEKLRKRNRAAAVGVMVALNAAMAYVVQHNYRVMKE
jgi:hypothetical protein